MKTELCNRLGIEVPIICAPMGPQITTPELAAAVSNAGGLGLLSFGAMPPPMLRDAIKRMRSLTAKPFGVNFILEFPAEEQIALCIEERVPVLSFFSGDVAPYIEAAHRARLTVIDQVGSVSAARRSAEAGADVLIAQGHEAGGHVAGEVSTMALVPRVVDAVDPLPVAAAGGIADGRGLVASLALGAQGVVMGTRFLATPESAAHPAYKSAVLRASEQDTTYTTLFGRDWPAPHRVIRTRFVEDWLTRPSAEAGDDAIGEAEFAGQRIPVQRLMSLPPQSTTTGEIESMALYAGQSAGLCQEVVPAVEIVTRCIEQARDIILRLSLY